MGNCMLQLPQKKIQNPQPVIQDIIQQALICKMPLYMVKDQQFNQQFHKMIVSIINSLGQLLWIGSGILLSHDIILTAAHNIYNKNQDRHAQKEKCKIYIGPRGITNQYYQVQNWIYSQKYKQTKGNDYYKYDYALIKLKNKYQQQFEFEKQQFLQLSLPCRCIMQKQSNIYLEIYGYPMYQNNYKPFNKQRNQFYLNQYGCSQTDSIFGFNQSNQRFLIYYNISTASGSSGCPIIEKNHIIGIHVGANTRQKYNVGRLITKQMLQEIQNLWHKLKGTNRKFDGLKGTCLKCGGYGHHSGRILPDQQIIKKYKQIEIIQKQADKCLQNKDYKISLQKYQQCLQFLLGYNNSYNQSFKANWLKYKVNLLKFQLEYNLDIHFDLRKILSIVQNQKGQKSIEVAQVCRLIGRVYWAQDKKSQAKGYFRRARIIWDSQANKGHINYSKIMANIGAVQDFNEKYNEALQHYKYALEIQQQLKQSDRYTQMCILNNIGRIQYLNNRYQQSRQYYLKSIKIYEQIKQKRYIDHKSINNTYQNIGIIYIKQNEYKKAKEVFKKSLFIEKQLKLDKIQTIKTIAYIYFNLENYSKSRKYYRKIIEKINNNNNSNNDKIYNIQSAIYIKYIGDTYWKQKNIQLACNKYQIFIKIYNQNNKKDRDYGLAQFNLGIYYMKVRQRYQQAYQALNQSLIQFQQFQTKQDIIKCKQYLRQLQQKLKEQNPQRSFKKIK